MPNLVAITVKDHATAFDLRADVVKLQAEYLISLEDAVVVTRGEDRGGKGGGVQLHQAQNLVAAGALGGSLWGLLIGSLFLSPVFGTLVGAGTGALSGKLSDIGINDDFMRDLAADLAPGTAAVFLLVRSASADKVIERLEAYRGKGRILRTSLTTADEAELKAFLEPDMPA